jgi:hypothetical protein
MNQGYPRNETAVNKKPFWLNPLGFRRGDEVELSASGSLESKCG